MAARLKARGVLIALGLLVFGAAAIWYLAQQPVPEMDGTNIVNRSAKFYGKEITFRALAVYETGNRFPPEQIAKLEVEHSPEIRVDLVRVTDQREQIMAVAVRPLEANPFS